jgi:hypothetical protein
MGEISIYIQQNYVLLKDFAVFHSFTVSEHSTRLNRSHLSLWSSQLN